MKVLLLYQFGNHKQLIDKLISNLQKCSIIADSFNIIEWDLHNQSQLDNKLIIKTLKPFFRIRKIHGFLLILFQNRAIISLAKHFDIIDIHFLSQSYDKIIPIIKRLDKKVKITVWGSDFYRVNLKRAEDQRFLYSLSDCIQIPTLRMKSDFINKYPECENKVRLAHFGIQQFELINDYFNPEKLYGYRDEFGIPKNKIIIGAGYNGSRTQQHSVMIDSVFKLESKIKEKVFLLLQMTYGLTSEYLNYITDQLYSTGLDFKIITRLLSKEEIAKLRLITNIALNIQTSDAFSASIQEYIYAGSILIAGNWLPYDFMKDQEIYFIETDIHSLTDKLTDCLTNLELHQSKISGNREKIHKFSSWENSINDWCVIYNELLNL